MHIPTKTSWQLWNRYFHVLIKYFHDALQKISPTPLPGNHWNSFCHYRLVWPVLELCVCVCVCIMIRRVLFCVLSLLCSFLLLNSTYYPSISQFGFPFNRCWTVWCFTVAAISKAVINIHIQTFLWVYIYIYFFLFLLGKFLGVELLLPG